MLQTLLRKKTKIQNSSRLQFTGAHIPASNKCAPPNKHGNPNSHKIRNEIYQKLNFVWKKITLKEIDDFKIFSNINHTIADQNQITKLLYLNYRNLSANDFVKLFGSLPSYQYLSCRGLKF
ncbi:unnamed protein product [Caenorhabditis angaria]|uniref:Uncharacterized protein n=1 Tax=Caenorhabditis angaria TaxID=860376 RepID=A0A9P1IL62_9PELO|nr:unnamed protein product [Caenorhabditis angaria]